MTDTPSALPPYAQALDMTIVDEINGVPVIGMPFTDRVQGRPGYLHGGAISGLLEIAAIAAVHRALQAKGSHSASQCHRRFHARRAQSDDLCCG
jgi:acyl-coenzyme A thioesterase PaaI-like protein